MIALKNVTKSYEGKQILSGLSLRIDPGSCLCITGESGCGKSTLLRLLIRADDPDMGTIEVDGVNIRTLPPQILQLYRRRVGILFQEQILLEHATIEENIGLPLELLGAPEALRLRNTADLLKRLCLSSKAKLFPKNLSASEQQLVCVARALIAAPMVIIADEPFFHLDAKQAKIVLELLDNMRKKGTTVVLFSRHAATGKPLGAQTVELKDGKIAKGTEQESAISPAMDAHRILEEKENEHVEDIASINEGTNAASEKDVPSSEPPRSGKRIRITSIGSNS